MDRQAKVLSGKSRRPAAARETNHRQSSVVAEIKKEMKLLQKHSEQLGRINDLYAVLGVATGLAGMLNAFSTWLSPLVDHEMIGYIGSSECGQERCIFIGSRSEDEVSELEDALASGRFGHGEFIRSGNYYGCQWQVKTPGESGTVVLLRGGRDFRGEELSLFSEVVNILISHIKRGLEYESLYHQATKDPLTGLFNRWVLEEQGEKLLSAARRYGRPVSLIALDLDNFKKVNDNFGHLRGDSVLRDVAKILREGVRECDLPIRTGGDEFVALLDDTDECGAVQLAERLQRSVSELNVWPEEGVQLTVSIGVSQFADDACITSWADRTDGLLYSAKSRVKRPPAGGQILKSET